MERPLIQSDIQNKSVDIQFSRCVSTQYLELFQLSQHDNRLHIRATPNILSLVYINHAVNYANFIQTLMQISTRWDNFLSQENVQTGSFELNGCTLKLNKTDFESMHIDIILSEDDGRIRVLLSYACIQTILIWSIRYIIKLLSYTLPVSYNLRPFFQLEQKLDKKSFINFSAKLFFEKLTHSQDVEFFFNEIKNIALSYFEACSYTALTDIGRVIFQFNGSFNGDILFSFIQLGYVNSIISSFNIEFEKKIHKPILEKLLVFYENKSCKM